MKRQLQVGDHVKYAGRFLRSIGVHTGDMCFAVGIITQVAPCGGTMLADVDWLGGEMLPTRVNVANLVDAARIHIERID